MINRKETRRLLKRALSLSTAGETEIVLLGLESQLTRFANNGIHQNVAETNHYLVVRAILGHQVGVAATNDLTDAGIERALEQATAAARLLPENPDFPGLPAPTDLPEVGGFDDATAGFSPAARARAVGTVCRRAKEKKCVASGAFRTSVHEYAVANSHDLFVYHPVTEADVTVVVMTEDSSGFASDASWAVADVDMVARGGEAIDKALRSRAPQPLEPGVYPVVLEPYATYDLVRTLSLAAGANPVQEERSWKSGRQGQQLLSPLVSIWDDGLDPTGWPLPFDFEGTGRRRVDVVRQGIAGDTLYDRAAADKDGRISTGHALPATNPYNPWLNNTRYGPLPLHVFMAPGENNTEELIAGVDRGLYVTRFWYTRTVHPREAVVTGMTRDGTFLIEGGELTTPVRNMRFTQSYVEALAGTQALGSEVRRQWTDPGLCTTPAVRLAAFDFTGTTAF